MPEQGCYDQPFIYVFNADALTDGIDYRSLSIPMLTGSDFLLRRVCGRPNVAQSMRYYGADGRTMASRLYAMARDQVVVPEHIYPPDSQILIDLGIVARGNWPYVAIPGSVPNYWSQLAFQGVRRFYGQKAVESTYPFYTKPYTITATGVMTLTGRMAPAYQIQTDPTQVNVQVENYDFELHRITATIIKNAVVPVEVVVDGAMKIRLYDAWGKAMMNEPVLDVFITENGPDWNSCFPVPTMMYPAGSEIKVDIQSLLLDTEVPATLNVEFHGVQRFPRC